MLKLLFGKHPGPKKPKHPNNRFGLGDNTISFVLAQNNLPKNVDTDINFQTLFLLDSSYQFDIFQFLPKIFTITTRNGTSHFNYEMISNASNTILKELEENPIKFEYHLDIADEENVLEKFSQLFQGKKVKFSEENLPVTYKIVRTLQISKCPNFLKPYNLRTKGIFDAPKISHLYNFDQDEKQQENETEKDIVINQADFNSFILQNSFKNFTIITQKKEYKCKLYAVYSSKVIREYLKKNEEANSYKYEIEDEFEEFENINKIFNFERVHISNDNAEILNTMIKELEIECLYEAIDEFLTKYDQAKTEFNVEEDKIDKINSLFQNINENNFQEIEEKIIKYAKNKEESEIQELCSYFIQHVKTENNHHKQELLSDLLIDLDKKSNTKEPLKILLPQFIRQLLFILGITKSTCSFAYILYKKRMISKNSLFNSIKRNFKPLNKKYFSYFIPYENNKDKENNIAIYFLPELKTIQIKIQIESKPQSRPMFGKPQSKQMPSKFETKSLYDIFVNDNKDDTYNNNQFLEYLNVFLPDKLNVYKKIRDKGEPDDEITKALRNDDVDKLQQILTMSKIKHQEQATVPYNIFEEYIDNGNTNYINYSAAYGSIKCFKYLLLNHHNIDDKTFEYSIYGGNIEIIKIVDQQKPKKKIFNDLIVRTIIKHQNDLFDWLFEKKFSFDITKNDTKLLYSLVKCSVKNGNAHALIEIINKGFDLSSLFEEMVDLAAANGFYTIIQLIHKIVPKKQQSLSLNELLFSTNFIPCVSFGNTSILNFYIDYFDDHDLRSVYSYSVCKGYLNVIKFIDNLPESKFQEKSLLYQSCLITSLDFTSDEIFNYLLSKLDENSDIPIGRIDSVLDKAIKLKQSQRANKIIKTILSLDQEKDLTNDYILSLLNNLTDVCQFLLDNKAFINYETVFENFNKISLVDEKTFNLFINNIPPILKQLFIDTNIHDAIKNKNIHLIKYLLNQNVNSEFALIEAVMSNDIKVVDLVLEHFDTNLINKSTKEGTALSIAVGASNFEIVDKLLSVEGIDASLVNVHNKTALNIAIMNQDDRICTRILDFYGENLKDQVSQLNKSIKIFLRMNSNTSMFPISSKMTENKKSSKKINPNMIPVLKRMLEVENVDLNCCEGDYSVLSFACKINDRSLVEYLLKTTKVKLNQRDPNLGNTALIVSILNENYDIAKVLISEDNIELNMSNYENETALTISVEKEREDIINMIINNNKFEPTKSRLNYAFYISTPKISKLLISTKTLDVNYLNKISRGFYAESAFGNKLTKESDVDFPFCTKLTNIVQNKIEKENCEDISTIIDLIDLIINHQSFDKEKSLARLALFYSTSRDCDIEIFIKLLSIFEKDVNILDENGQSLLVSAVTNKNKKVVQFLLNDPNFDCNKNEILYAYVLSIKTSSKIKEELSEFIKVHSQSIDFNRLMPDGKTPPTNILNQND